MVKIQIFSSLIYRFVYYRPTPKVFKYWAIIDLSSSFADFSFISLFMFFEVSTIKLINMFAIWKIYTFILDFAGCHPHWPEAHQCHHGCSWGERDQDTGTQLFWERPEPGQPFQEFDKKGYFQVAGKYLAGAVRNLNKLNLSTTNLSEGQVWSFESSHRKPSGPRWRKFS